MELPNRLKLEAAFARNLSRVSSRHRRELIDLLGNPPDVNRVPEEFWSRVETEEKNAVAAILLLLMMQSAEAHFGLLPEFAQVGRTVDDFIPQIEAAANQRAADFSQQYVTTGRERLERFGRDTQARFGIGGQIHPQEIADEATGIFGPSRDAGIAASETTGAASTGAETVIGQTVGFSEKDTWFTQEDQRVCPICEPLHEKPRSYWARFFPQGPPAHPKCRCWVEYSVEKLVPAGGVR